MVFMEDVQPMSAVFKKNSCQDLQQYECQLRRKQNLHLGDAVFKGQFKYMTFWISKKRAGTS